MINLDDFEVFEREHYEKLFVCKILNRKKQNLRLFKLKSEIESILIRAGFKYTQRDNIYYRGNIYVILSVYRRESIKVRWIKFNPEVDEEVYYIKFSEAFELLDSFSRKKIAFNIDIFR